MKNIFYVFMISFLIIITACEKKNDAGPRNNNQIPVDTSREQSYVLISNEGPFLTGAGTITRYNRNTKTYEKKLFETANNYPLGNIVQSVEAYDDKVFIVVNNANKIEVVDDSTFKSIAVINNINLPRYFLPIDQNKAYVSCWDDKVAVIDITSYTVKTSINVKTGPEKMLRCGDKVFVLNIGGFGTDSTYSVLDCNTDMLDTTIVIGKRPSGIVLDRDSRIWILCSGQGFNGYPLPGDTPGQLLCIDPDNYSVIYKYNFPSQTEHPDKLVINLSDDILYYLYPGGIYQFRIGSNSLEQNPFIAYSNMFYSLGFDHREELIYVSDPLDYVQQGWVYKYDATNGIVVDSVQSGVIPGEFYFN